METYSFTFSEDQVSEVSSAVTNALESVAYDGDKDDLLDALATIDDPSLDMGGSFTLTKEEAVAAFKATRLEMKLYRDFSPTSLVTAASKLHRAAITEPDMFVALERAGVEIMERARQALVGEGFGPEKAEELIVSMREDAGMVDYNRRFLCSDKVRI
jgi:hypothetical protein